MQLRSVIKPLIKFALGNGEKVLFWLYVWHLKVQLLSVYPNNILFYSGIPLIACLSLVIRGGNWNWPPARSLDMLNLQHFVAHLRPSTYHDSIVWTPRSGQFQLGPTWNSLRVSNPKDQRCLNIHLSGSRV